MEDHLFHHGPAPSGYRQEFEHSLFNDPEHLRLQSADGWKSFCILNEKHKTVRAIVHFHINEDTARSPVKSPFGSVEFSDTLPSAVLFRFFEFVESSLRTSRVTKIVIKHPPVAYQPEHAALIQTFLFNLGYRVVDAEVGAVLPVSNDPVSKDNWELRKLRQAKEAGLIFREVPLTDLNGIYSFILACRKEKGYPLSMSLSGIQEAVKTFGEKFLLFGVYQDNDLAAASISVRITGNILYNFYSAHASKFDAISPVVFLIGEICHFCERNSITMLDLGTSAVDGKPNFNLLDFKLRLGGKPTQKLTFEKILV